MACTRIGVHSNWRALDLTYAFSFCKQIALATADICFDFRYRTVVMPKKKLEQERMHNELLSEGKFTQ